MKFTNIIFLTAFAISGSVFTSTTEVQTSINAKGARQIIGGLDRALRLMVQESLADRIRWKVGEYHNVNVEMAFGNGTGVKTVTQDVPEQNALWYVNTFDLMGQTQKTEALMSREDGHIIRLLVNGEEKDPNEDQGDIEIIEQYQTKVTVPAGTFDCFYLKAKQTPKGGEAQEIELWINPTDVNLDGTLKVVLQSMFGPVTMSLTKFGKK